MIRELQLGDHPIANELDERLGKIRAAAYNFTEPRNQLVSHMDLAAHNITPEQRPIPSFIKAEFEAFYSATGDLMNDIRAVVGMIPNMYEWGMTGHGCGRKLIHRLETAQEQLTEKSNKTLHPTAGSAPV